MEQNPLEPEQEIIPDKIQKVSIEEEMKSNEQGPTIYSPVLRGSVQLPADANIKGGQTDYNTGTGFFLGYSTDNYKFSVGDPSSYYITFDGSSLTVNAIQSKVTKFTASANLKASSDGEVTQIDTSYAKKKEAYVGWGGTIRVSFDLKVGGDGAGNVYGRIYQNGVAVGTERTKTGTSYTTYTEDFSIYAGDLIQLYIKAGTGTNVAYAENFRIGYDRSVEDDVEIIT